MTRRLFLFNRKEDDSGLGIIREPQDDQVTHGRNSNFQSCRQSLLEVSGGRWNDFEIKNQRDDAYCTAHLYMKEHALKERYEDRQYDDGSN